MASKVEVKSLEELESMHTGTLMTRRSSFLKCEESFELSDRNGYEGKPLPSLTGVIEFKNTEEWQQGYNELKKVLSKRENLPNKQDRRATRQAKGKGSN